MKILFVNYTVIGEETPTGNTLLNMFSGFGGAEIMQYTLSSSCNTENSAAAVIKNGKTNALNDYICRKHSGTAENKGKVSAAGGSLKGKIIKRAKKSLLLLNQLIPFKMSEEVGNAIAAFGPQVIYTLGADINVFRHCIKISDKFNIPIIVHNMDDIYNTAFSGRGLLTGVARKKLRKMYENAYSRSKMSLAIGPKMQRAYEEKFGIPFGCAMNCAEDMLESAVKAEKGLMIFSGGLHGGRAQVLKELADFLEKNDAMHLEIYTSPKDYGIYAADFENYKKTAIKPFVEKEKMFDNLMRAEVLLHVESFEPENIRYFKLSMSTKLPEYVSVGRPILCIGPDEIATVGFIKETKIGVCVSDLDELKNAFAVLAGKKETDEMSKNAAKVFNTYFKKSSVNSRLEEAFKANIN